MKLCFDIEHPGELGAGIWPYSETITVEVASGDPGGASGEFENELGEFLAEWFDGATVTLRGRIDQK